MTSSTEALRAALAAAGLSVEAMSEEQRAMFTSLTEEEVTRLIGLRIGQPADPRKPAADGAAGSDADGAADPDPPRPGKVEHGSSDG